MPSLSFWQIVYIVGFFVCAIINVHLGSRQWEKDADDQHMVGLLIASVILGLVWPGLLLAGVILYSGLLLTKLRRKDV